MRILAVLVPVVLLAGCASTQPPADVQKAVADLRSFTRADLTAAAARADKATDAEAPYRARCYRTLLAHVPEGSTVGTALAPPAGAVDAFEIAAEADQKLRAGTGPIVPVDVHADCAVIVTSMEQFAVRMGVRIGGDLGGVPAVGNILK